MNKIKATGLFGEFGGSFVPDDLQIVLNSLLRHSKPIKTIQTS